MFQKRFNVLTRAKLWKAHVENSIVVNAERIAQLEARFQSDLATEILLRKELQLRHDGLEKATIELLRFLLFTNVGFDGSQYLAVARRGDVLRLLKYPKQYHPQYTIGSLSGSQVTELVLSGRVTRIETAEFSLEGVLSPWKDASDLIAMVPGFSTLATLAIESETARFAERDPAEASAAYEATSVLLSRTPDLIDFLALGQSKAFPTLAGTPSGIPEPFTTSEQLPPFRVAAEPRVRSVVFLHNSFYHFNTLTEALRRQGWTATTVSVEAPDSPQRQFYHGEDINLYDSDPASMKQKIRSFFQSLPERCGTVHFCGQGHSSFFPSNFSLETQNVKLPWDMLELRRHNIVIGYSVSGCLDGGLASSFYAASGGVCDRCVWQERPDVCSDSKNKQWISKLDSFCDWISLETDWVTPERKSRRHVRGPVVYSVSSETWRPDLAIPENHTIEKHPGELLVYHAVGNYKSRSKGGRDIKGTGAVLAAIDRLKSEGFPIKLFFATDLPSRDVRYYQVQADIVIDQLNYGRLGANARETLMLGRPLITSLRPGRDDNPPWISECPAANASEYTIYEVLRDLAVDPERRQRMAKASRTFALRWYESDICAQRFEMVLDRVRNRLPADSVDLYSTPLI